EFQPSRKVSRALFEKQRGCPAGHRQNVQQSYRAPSSCRANWQSIDTSLPLKKRTNAGRNVDHGRSDSLDKPRILRITRPYESVEDYIASEGWTISSKRMILLDQPRLERDTLVRFEVSLT